MILAVKPQYCEAVFEEIRAVLKDGQIVISLAPGQTIASVGHTGAGKTTLIDLLMRLYDVDRG